MSRKFTASKTHLRPDPRFGSKLAGKFINCVMHNGKKSVASGVFYDAMDLIEKRLPNENPIDVFTRAVENVSRQLKFGLSGSVVQPIRFHAGEQEPAADVIDQVAVNGRPRKERTADGRQAG